MVHVLVLRFSAMGDVLMTVPVIDSLARRHPDVRITVVSRAWAQPIFKLLPANVRFIVADLKDEHKGMGGLNRLYRKLLGQQPTHVADLHDVLRTQWLRMRFKLVRMPVEYIRKGRKARRRFITAEVKTPQRPVFEKYAEVFHRLGFDFIIDFRSLYPVGGADLAVELPDFDVAQRPERHWVGIAPFAAHQGKVYPLELMEQVVSRLSARGDVRVFLFGAGTTERETLETWAGRYPHVESLVGQLPGIAAELALISHLQVMLCMDSANMHLASLVNVPVLSIWGATHPFGGFLGYGQSMDNVIQCERLACRPCSIYGQKACKLGDYPCLRNIAPDEVVSRVLGILQKSVPSSAS